MTVAQLLVGALAATSLVSATLPKLHGVNLAGLDFGIDTNGGQSGGNVPPPISQVDHFATAGANVCRLPFGWQAATPQLGGALDANFAKTLDALVQQGLSKGQWVILDLHNYARWNGGIVGQGGPTNAQVSRSRTKSRRTVPLTHSFLAPLAVRLHLEHPRDQVQVKRQGHLWPDERAARPQRPAVGDERSGRC